MMERESRTNTSIIIVLGYKNDGSGNLHDIAKQRCQAAFKVYLQSKSHILCTGGIDPKFNATDQNHGAYLQSYLLELGVEQQDFLPIVASRNTYEDGYLCKPLLQSSEVNQLKLVTSDFHMKRAHLWFSLFYPKLEITLHPAETLLPSNEIAHLKAHERQAIERFYCDFPEKRPI